jgi:hypothetical protein
MVSASKKIVDKLVGDSSVVAKPTPTSRHVEQQPDLFTAAPDKATKDAPEPRSYGTYPQSVTYADKWRRVRPYRGVREQRPDGPYANLVCPNGALHCIRVEPGDAVIIVRRDGEFVDMVVKGATDKGSALQAAARKFLKLIERVR